MKKISICDHPFPVLAFGSFSHRNYGSPEDKIQQRLEIYTE